MKKVISILLSVLMLCSVTTGLDLTAYAADTTITGKCGENATYLYNKNTKTLTISGTGVIDSKDSDFPSSDSIVSLVIKDGITEIGNEMFFECENLENIVIPDSVVNISRDAFEGSKYYNDDSNWQDGQLYINHALICVKADSAKGEFKIKDGTTVIADIAFGRDDFDAMTSVYIPESVKGITGESFCMCLNLKSIAVNQNNKYYTSDNGVLFNKTKTVLITYPQGAENESYSIPKGVKTIGEDAFSSCGHLSNIIISDEVTSIGYSAFQFCGISSITIPNAVTYIGPSAFSHCWNLSSITIPDSVTHIGADAFSGCNNLNKIDMSSNIESVGTDAFAFTAYYKDKSNWDNGVLYVGAALIAANADLTGTYQVKDSTRVIVDCAFRGCGMAGVTLPDGLVNIGDHAFAYCDNLESIIIPDTVTEIGNDAFKECRGLKKVVLSSALTVVPCYAFTGCEKLESIRIPDSVTEIGEWAFYQCTALEKVVLSSTLTVVPRYAFTGCEKLESICIPDSVTEIGEWAFYQCTALEKVAFSESLTTIGEMAFGECSKISSIRLPDSVKVIEDEAFYKCIGLKSLTLSTNLVSIGDYAFQDNCLSTVYIPGDHVRVGDGAFSPNGDNALFVFCNSTTQIDTYNHRVYYVDKAATVKNFKDLYSSDYDWDHYTLYSFVANESGTYYSGEDYWNSDYMYIFDENYNLVSSNKIDSIAEDEGEPTGGFSFNLEKGHTYYFPYSGDSTNRFEVIKDYQYIDPGKQYIQGDINCEYLKIVYPDDSFRMEKYYGRANIDVSQPVTLQYCGKIITFSLNDPVTFNSIEVLNSQYIDSGFIAGLKAYDGKVIEKYPVVYRLHLSNGKTYDIENYSMWCGTASKEPDDYWSYYECSTADGRKFGIEFTYNDSKPNELKVLVNSRYSDTSPSVIVAANNEHTHNFVLTATNPPTCVNAGDKTYTCTICEKEEHKDETPALGHAYIAQVIAQPTCTVKGITRYTCSRCGDSYTAANIKSKGHQNKSQLTKATTAKDGQSYKKCTVCCAVTGKTVIAKASNIKLNKTAYTYNGKVQKPSVTVKDSKGKTLKNGTDYTVSYPKGMKNVGKYTVKVTLKGNYSGSKSMTYSINPKGTGVSKVKAAKKGFKVTWKKQATQTTGYQVQYSTNSKFKKAKTVTISKNKTTSKSVSKLSAKKKYYVRVRTYKTVKVNGKNVKLYSGWSKAKSVTSKK